MKNWSWLVVESVEVIVLFEALFAFATEKYELNWLNNQGWVVQNNVGTIVVISQLDITEGFNAKLVTKFLLNNRSQAFFVNSEPFSHSVLSFRKLCMVHVNT
jgi:hypothetical protein